jgi:hypothetical protein
MRVLTRRERERGPGCLWRAGASVLAALLLQRGVALACSHNGSYSLADISRPGALNIVETILNFSYLYLAYRASPPYAAVAPLVGFTAVVMTESKTALYWLQDHLGGPNGWVYTGHCSTRDWWLLFALPNGAWLVGPAVVAYVLGREIAHSLRSGAGVAGHPKGPAAGTRSRSKSGRKSLTKAA